MLLSKVLFRKKEAVASQNGGHKLKSDSLSNIHLEWPWPEDEEWRLRWRDTGSCVYARAISCEVCFFSHYLMVEIKTKERMGGTVGPGIPVTKDLTSECPSDSCPIAYHPYFFFLVYCP